MSTWSSRRKLAYSSTIIVVLIIVVIIPAFYFLYTPPTCNDGKQNGKETGIDCGGKCILLCQSSFLPPRIGWGGAKIEKVADGLYNVAALIINPNVDGAAINAPYKVSLYDEEGMFITEKKGTITLYAHRNSLAFEPAVKTNQSIPVKAIFEFIQPPVWFKSSDRLGGLVVIDKKYSEDDNSSSLEVTLENRTLYPYKDIVVSVILSNINGDAIGFSRTVIDSVSEKSGREVAPFTWSFDRNNEVTSIEVLPLITPIADR